MTIKDPMFELSRGAALVTGAAGGIGREIALGLARRGPGVVCIDRAGSDTRSLVEQIRREGGAAIACDADVTDEEAMAAAVAEGERSFGAIAYAVNAAGINIAAEALEITQAQWSQVVAVNMTGILTSCQAQARAMLRHGGGSIVNIASMSASIINHKQDQVAYYASKAGVKHMTKSLAAEWAERGIRVNCISPGYTITPMLKASEETLAGFRRMTPMGRLAEASEMVGPTVFLLSQASSYVTGHDLKIDGGYTAW
ncbi:SDR family oxidoreductase [Shinella zoogloeoides]|uniref:SDR family oxidoreductase n=1 Tax=Shinella zoogloeoides TaxID=352475 RepID=UPI0028B13E2A|nr:SDR family oxidoreductase [Shinella zoogloeoides]